MRIRYSQRQDGSVVAVGRGRYSHDTHHMTWDPRTGAVWLDAQARPFGVGMSEHAFHVQVETLMECDEYSPAEIRKCAFNLPTPVASGGWAVACGCGHFREHGPSRNALIRIVYRHYNEVNPDEARLIAGVGAR